MWRAVIDTNVLFEGLTRPAGAARSVVEAWLRDGFVACVSNSLGSEYLSVLSSRLSERRWRDLRPIFASLLGRSAPVEIHFTWRPMSPDPDDDLVIDCALNAGAAVVTRNLRDFAIARRELGLTVLTPEDFLSRLHEDGSGDARDPRGSDR